MLCVATLWYLLGYPLGYSLIARGHARRFLAGAAVAGILSITLDLALIPSYGMIGAAIANAVCFGAGSMVWVAGYGQVDRSVAIVLAAVAASSVAVVLALTISYLKIPLGAALLATGIATFPVYHLRGR